MFTVTVCTAASPPVWVRKGSHTYPRGGAWIIPLSHTSEYQVERERGEKKERQKIPQGAQSKAAFRRPADRLRSAKNLSHLEESRFSFSPSRAENMLKRRSSLKLEYWNFSTGRDGLSSCTQWVPGAVWEYCMFTPTRESKMLVNEGSPPLCCHSNHRVVILNRMNTPAKRPAEKERSSFAVSKANLPSYKYIYLYIQYICIETHFLCLVLISCVLLCSTSVLTVFLCNPMFILSLVVLSTPVLI